MTGELEVTGLKLPWEGGEARNIQVRLRNTGFARWLSADHATGGVMVDIHWRADLNSPPGERQWLKLPRDLNPTASVDLEVLLRRPLENANLLVIEPHVKKVGGFNTVGGPQWTMNLE